MCLSMLAQQLIMFAKFFELAWQLLWTLFSHGLVVYDYQINKRAENRALSKPFIESVLLDRWFSGLQVDLNEGKRMFKQRRLRQEEEEVKYRDNLTELFPKVTNIQPTQKELDADFVVGKDEEDDPEHDDAEFVEGQPESMVVTGEDGVSAQTKDGKQPKDAQFVDVAPYIAWLHHDSIDIVEAVATAVEDLPIIIKAVEGWGTHAKTSLVAKDRFWDPQYKFQTAENRSGAFNMCVRSHFNFPGHSSKGCRSLVWGVYVFCIIEDAYFYGRSQRKDRHPEWLAFRKAIEDALDPHCKTPEGHHTWTWTFGERANGNSLLGRPWSLFLDYRGGVQEVRWLLVRELRLEAEIADLKAHFDKLLSSSAATAVNPLTGKIVPRAVSMAVVRTLGAAYAVRF